MDKKVGGKKIKKGDILLPPFKGYKLGQACVYKLNFKKGYFYIGSTVCIASRISGHRGHSGHPTKHPIKKLMRWDKLVSIEILRTGQDIRRLRRGENKIITDYFKTVMCVNMARKYV